jgi:hypothetical protein
MHNYYDSVSQPITMEAPKSPSRARTEQPSDQGSIASKDVELRSSNHMGFSDTKDDHVLPVLKKGNSIFLAY